MRLTQTLSRQLQSTVFGDATDFYAGLIGTHGVLKASLYLAHVLAADHVDEVDNDNPPKVAQPELPGDLIGCFEVCFVHGRFVVVFFGRFAAVYVNGNKRLRLVDYQFAARGKLDVSVVQLVDCCFDARAPQTPAASLDKGDSIFAKSGMRSSK